MTIFINNRLLPKEAIPYYPDGAMNFKPLYFNLAYEKQNTIRAWCFDMEEFFKALMLYKSLNQVSKAELIFEHLAGLRQDKTEGHVPDFADFLVKIVSNSPNIIFNVPHCEISWDMTEYTSLYQEGESFLSSRSNRTLIFPDKTALRRYNFGRGNPASMPDSWPFFSKTRRAEDGWITLTAPDVGVAGLEVLMIDDVADGGITAILAADELRNKGAEKVHLHVHHGLFNNGQSLEKLFLSLDTVSCHYYMPNIETGVEIPSGLIVNTIRSHNNLVSL